MVSEEDAASCKCCCCFYQELKRSVVMIQKATPLKKLLFRAMLVAYFLSESSKISSKSRFITVRRDAIVILYTGSQCILFCQGMQCEMSTL